jgi:DNA polymerase-3 subunit delta'
VTDTWDNLKGHTHARELFRRSIAQGRLSHAYLLAGPDGIGKRLFARLLAQSLFCRETDDADVDACGTCRACRGFAAGTWPDYLEIRRPQGKAVIPVSLLIGDEARRGREGLCYELSMTPQSSERRIAVINDAHCLNDEGANAILKTLEEPPARSLILLVCDHADSLLPTIRSRCQVVRFFPLPTEDVAELLLRQELLADADEAAEVAAMAEGSMTLAAQLIDPELRALRDLVTSQLAELEHMQPWTLSKQLSERLDAISSGGDELRRNAQWLLRFVAQFISRRVRTLAAGDFSDPLTSKWGIRMGVDVLAPTLQSVGHASRRIEGNSPVALVLEAMFDEIARTFRTKPISAR